MKGFLIAGLMVLASTASAASAQALDTLVDVGGHRLHFHVIRGHGIPILFESGGGDDATVWKEVLQPIAAVTGTTLVAYDRAGWGQSGMDTTHHGIINDVQGLEVGLRNLGFTDDIVLVAHSLGGFLATVYASRHPQQVKAAVLIDANLACFFTDDMMRRMRTSDAELADLKTRSAARYYQAIDWDSTIKVIRRTAFPTQIPVIDIVAERTLFNGTPDAERWTACHAEFVGASSYRQGLTAYGSGHYVFISSPELVIAAVAKAYASVAADSDRAGASQRSAAYSLEAIAGVRRKEAQYRHSADDLNSWGYALLQQGAQKEALAVFQLNVMRHPESANLLDSLAEGYEAIGDRASAIKTYRRALELDPKLKHSDDRLKALTLPGPS